MGTLSFEYLPTWNFECYFYFSKMFVVAIIVTLAISFSLQLAFKKIPGSHQLSFNEISDAAKLPLDEVEFLIIKALALGLVKGHIDQVEENFNVSWVQPRVLSKDQVLIISALC